MTIVLLLLALQDAREVYATDRPVEVRVPVSGEAQHRATVVTFPEESLEDEIIDQLQAVIRRFFQDKIPVLFDMFRIGNLE